MPKERTCIFFLDGVILKGINSFKWPRSLAFAEGALLKAFIIHQIDTWLRNGLKKWFLDDLNLEKKLMQIAVFDVPMFALYTFYLKGLFLY